MTILMNSFETKIEKIFYLYINVFMTSGFRSDIYEDLAISRRTLYRYIDEINKCKLFTCPIEYNPAYKEYNPSAYLSDGLGYDCRDQIISFQASDSAIDTHLKRLAFIFNEFYSFFNSSDWDDEDYDDVSAPIVLEMFREKCPGLKISVRTIERDISLISRVYSYYLTEGPGMF